MKFDQTNTADGARLRHECGRWRMRHLRPGHDSDDTVDYVHFEMDKWLLD